MGNVEFGPPTVVEKHSSFHTPNPKFGTRGPSSPTTGRSPVAVRRTERHLPVGQLERRTPAPASVKATLGCRCRSELGAVFQMLLLLRNLDAAHSPTGLLVVPEQRCGTCGYTGQSEGALLGLLPSLNTKSHAHRARPFVDPVGVAFRVWACGSLSVRGRDSSCYTRDPSKTSDRRWAALVKRRAQHDGLSLPILSHR